MRRLPIVTFAFRNLDDRSYPSSIYRGATDRKDNLQLLCSSLQFDKRHGGASGTYLKTKSPGRFGGGSGLTVKRRSVYSEYLLMVSFVANEFRRGVR